MIDIKEYINKIISAALSELGVESNVSIEKSSNPIFGDFSTNIALTLTKQLKKNHFKLLKS